MDCQDNVQVESIQGEIVEYPEPPPGVKVLPNGAGWSHETKKIAPGMGPGTFAPDPHRITPETSQLYHQRRMELSVQAAMDGLTESARVDGAITGYDAWRFIIRDQARLSRQIKSGRASTEAAKFVGNAARLLPDRRQGSQDNGTSDKITVQIPEHIVIAMLQAARRSDDE